MIRVKNTAEIPEPLKQVGAFTAAVVDTIVAPADGFIKAIFVEFGLMGTDGTGAPTQDARVDIQKNGVSIFGGANPYFAWAHAGQVGTANTPSLPSSNPTSISVNPVPVKKGDRITLRGLQILNGTAPTQPSDLCVWVVFTRGPGWAPEATLLQQVDEND